MLLQLLRQQAPVGEPPHRLAGLPEQMRHGGFDGFEVALRGGDLVRVEVGKTGLALELRGSLPALPDLQQGDRVLEGRQPPFFIGVLVEHHVRHPPGVQREDLVAQLERILRGGDDGFHGLAPTGAFSITSRYRPCQNASQASAVVRAPAATRSRSACVRAVFSTAWVSQALWHSSASRCISKNSRSWAAKVRYFVNPGSK